MLLFGPPNVEKLKAQRDVRGLIKALGYQKDPGVREAAAHALGVIKSRQAVEPLIVALKDKGQSVRRWSAWALGRIGDSRAVEPLLATLKDEHQGVRAEGIRALGEIGDARALEPIIAAIKDGDYYVHEAAPRALAQIGAPAVGPLVAALKDENWGVRWAVAGALEQLGWQPDKSETGAIYWAARGEWDRCAEIGTPAVELLIAALKLGMSDAIRPLGRLREPRAVGLLIAALWDRDEKVRRDAAEALGKIGDTRAVEPLIRALKDTDGWVRNAAGFALGEIGDPQAVEPLIAILGDRPGVAATALGKIGDARAVEPLIPALKDENWNVRSAVAEALGKIGDARAVEPLITALGDRDERVCKAAARALGEIGDPRAVEPLVAALEQGAPATADALDMLGWQPDTGEARAAYWIKKHQWDKCVEIGELALGPLLAAFERGGKGTCQRAAMALGEIGDPRTVEPLIGALKDERGFMRRAAAEALVALYHSGKLDGRSKQRIVARRKTLAKPHRDESPPSDCHVDTGIGVTF